jgi:RNA polymerase sigma-70 factor (ECF subfamily)
MRESPQPAPLAYTPPEAEVEGRAARGRTVDKLFRDHNQDLLRFLQVKLQDEGEAREVAQEAYVRLLELENTKVVRFLRAYLFRIAANLAIDRLNARRRLRLESGTDNPELEQVRDPLDVERSFLAVEEFELFLTCLDELPPKCRQVFVMHRLRKLSTQEVAVQLRISDRMVRKHIARALIYCRYRLDGLSASAALERIGDDKEETRG